MMYITKKTLQHQGDCTMATRNCQVCLPINIENENCNIKCPQN